MPKFRLYILWALILAVVRTQISTNQLLSDEYLLQADKIDLFFQRTALMAVLKAKARRLMKSVEDADNVVYVQCANQAKTPVSLAQCVVGLMQSRDRHVEAETNAETENPWQTDWFCELKRLLWPSAESGQRPVVDSGRGATIFAPPVNLEKERLVHRLRDDLRRMIRSRHSDEVVGTPHAPWLFAVSPIQRPPISADQRVLATAKVDVESKGRLSSVPHESGKLVNWLRKRDLFVGPQNRFKRSTLDELMPSGHDLRTAMRSLTSDKKEEMRDFSFAFVGERQAGLLFRGSELDSYVYLSLKQREQQQESRIRKIARLKAAIQNLVHDRKVWPVNGESEANVNSNDEIGFRHEQLHSLTSYVFIDDLNKAKESISSPHAFVTRKPQLCLLICAKSICCAQSSRLITVLELMHPELLTYDVFSSRAFVLPILLPQGLLSRILSPSAFRAVNWTPTTLLAFIPTSDDQTAADPRQFRAFRSLDQKNLIRRAPSPFGESDHTPRLIPDILEFEGQQRISRPPTPFVSLLIQLVEDDSH